MIARQGQWVGSDRVDAYGRYVGLVYGGGECFDAALVEQGLADVYLYQEGVYLVPEMELKDYFSYTAVHGNSIEHVGADLIRFDANGGVFEILTALAYAAGGYVWSVDPDLGVHFRKVERADRVVFYDPRHIAASVGSASEGLANVLYVRGNPLTGTVNEVYARDPSVAEFGTQTAGLDYYALSFDQDADRLGAGLLDDVAYPTPCGGITFFEGGGGIQVGEIVELRGVPLRRLEPEVSGEWGDWFAGRMVGRVAEVRHRLTGKAMSTRVRFTSPLRSVESPLAFMVRSQPGEETLYDFRLDDAAVGLDTAYHVD